MLLDTSGLLCHFHADEPKHADARALFKTAGAKLTHSYVLSEFVTLAYARRLPRRPALAFATALLTHPAVEVVWVDENLHQAAVALLDARPDKAYSLCDAVSFVLLRERGLFTALTTDHHFTQEGFQQLL